MNRSASVAAVSSAARGACALSLLLWLLPLAATAQETAAPAVPALAAPAAAASWPHTLVRNGATVTIYQPQATSWPDRRRLTARAALSISRPGQAQPLMGTVEFAFASSVDEPAGVVNLSSPQLISSHFPALDTQQAADLEAKIRETLTQMPVRQVPLTSVLLSLKQLPVAAVKVSNAPPVIFYADRPASLVVFDGEPVLVPAAKSGLKYAVNTNWGVFTDQKAWYLLNNGFWYAAPQVGGPYAPVSELPQSFLALKKDPGFAASAPYIPAKRLSAKDVPTQVLVSQKPAEIIVT